MIVNNAELNSVEKIHYLKTCLSGEAFRLIFNVPVSNDTFATTWETLLVRYENKRFLVLAYLDELLNLQPIKTNHAYSLRSFLTTITECLSALRALDCQTHYWDPLLLHILVRLLDIKTREAWEVLLDSSSSSLTFSQFEGFLTCRTRAIESLASSSSGKDRLTRPSSKIDYRVKAYIATSSDSENRSPCFLCESNHHLAGCLHYQFRSLQQRRDIIIKHKLCYNCLGRHTIHHCSSSQRYCKCGRKYHTSLHSDHNASKQTFSRPQSSTSWVVKTEESLSVASSAIDQRNE